MSTMGFMISQTSTLALRAADGSYVKKSNEDNSFETLQAVETLSIVGKHDGVMDDDLIALLSDDAD